LSANSCNAALIDRTAASAPVGKLLFVETLGDTRFPLEGLGPAAIARRLGIGRAGVYRVLGTYVIVLRAQIRSIQKKKLGEAACRDLHNQYMLLLVTSVH
jgi:hypothetical protein